MKLSEELRWRGFVNQTTYKDLTELDKGEKFTFYHGFDASADSQAIGNLAAMMFDKVFMRHGHKAILLAGGATSLIGDPGGKTSERVLQDETMIAHNIQCANQQLQKVFAGNEFTLVNNLDWTRDLKVLDFFRDVGKHFSMTPLVQRDYIASRIGENGSGISYTEFSYTLLQGMDYLHLYDNYGCTLQLGGADQWGNCLSGVELIRKTRGKEVNVITLPLVINKSTGVKFGKSESGAVWLDPEKTSVYQFYQFWLNIDDSGVEDYLKIFTELGKPDIDTIMQEFNQNKPARAAQKALAYEVTKIVHGEKRADSVVSATNALFSGDLSQQDSELLKSELPSIASNRSESLQQLLVDTGLASSHTEATRFIDSGAISINGVKLLKIENFSLKSGNNLLKRGKNNFAIIEQK